jgi:ATP/ADP translocase
MTKVPLPVKLTIGLVIFMTGTLVVGNIVKQHAEYPTPLITLIILLGSIVSLLVIYQRRQHTDFATFAPNLLRSSLTIASIS